MEAIGWWALGIRMHGLFVRAWIQVASGKLDPAARRALQMADVAAAAAAAVADADPGDDPNVDQHKAKAKSRFRKGLRLMQARRMGQGRGGSAHDSVI